MIHAGLAKALWFERAVSVVLEKEGGFVDDPRDPGGITNFGISIKFAGSVNLDIDGDGKTTGEDIRALTREQAVELYRKHFWLPLRCHDLGDPGLALMVFDGGVNQGVRTVAKRLQRAAGAADDGIVGPQTIKAVKKWERVYPALITEVAARRGRRYGQTRNFDRFGLGWMRRLMDIHAKALAPWRP